ncbi:IclR family transcriptional regulator domain-containing protein [Cupriavidus metallidurans]|uniref:IclR family transcriptional regulator domain-containing protein n=1 Tax=Cupriavidus metallidurans TaxID=119219 RepID=UPI0040481F7E
MRVAVGSRVSGLNTAAGRAYLVALPPAEQRQALTAFRTDEKVAPAEAEAILANSRDEQRRLGCTTSFGEWLPDINSIAHAFRPGPSLPPMTLSCSGPNAIVPPAHLLEKVRPLLRDHIRKIEAAFGVTR